MTGRRRHFYFWCPQCKSRLHLETDEHKDDDERGVVVGPYGQEPDCPMCGTSMQDWDVIAAHDERFRNKGGWKNFLLWHAEQPKEKRSE